LIWSHISAAEGQFDLRQQFLTDTLLPGWFPGDERSLQLRPTGEAVFAADDQLRLG